MTIIDKLKKQKLLLGIVIFPMLLAIVYFGILARDRYISSSQVVVKKVDSSTDEGGSASGTQSMTGLAVLMSGGTSSSIEETMYVQQFIMSYDMLDILQKKLHWSEKYAGDAGDFWYYLPSDASREMLLKYYQRMVTASVDETTGILTIQVQAFDQKFAEETLRTIMAASDQFVNRISNQLALQQVSFAESELEKARHTLQEKRDLVLQFQSQHNLLDAQQAALAQNSVIFDLQKQLATADTVLRALEANLNESSPQVRQQKIHIDAIKQQINVEEQKLITKKSDTQLNVVASEYQGLQVDESIAQDIYTTAVTSLNSARMEASRKLRALVIIVSPNLPEQSLFPRRVYNLFTTLIILLLIYGIARFVIATVNDHKD